MRAGLLLCCTAAATLLASCQAFLPPLPQAHSLVSSSRSLASPPAIPTATALFAVDEDVEEITKKYGLEAGLFSIFKKKEGGGGDSAAGGGSKTLQAKDLLAKYGSAYILTSISLSLVSFGLCYALISAGVDVATLLAKVGIQASSQTETAGTVALAYAAHKAASPIRFPPTVALTPFVANAIGKKPVEDDGAASE